MANILGLALKVSADAGAVLPALTPVEKALKGLADAADATVSVFDQFAAASGAAGDAQANYRTQLDTLTAALQDGSLTAEEYRNAFNAIQDSANKTAQVFRDGAATTAQFATAQDRAAEKITALSAQLKAGAIDAPTFGRALSSIAGVDLTATDRGRQLIDNLAASAKAGSVDVNAAAGDLIGFGKAGDEMAKSLQPAGLKLNELSGIFAALPGPLGDIAGRFSGLVSAGEGLSRVFSGGLSGGFSSLAGAATALVNPFTLAVAGIAAFGAAAAAIVTGLQALSGRVEELSNTASRLGTSFQFVQVLETAAKNSGVAVDGLATGLQKFEVNISKAREGTGEAAKAFEALGISQEQLKTSDPTELAQQVAVALDGITDPAERAALATTLLGKSGLSLLPAFASLDDTAKSMDKFRTTINEVDVQRLSSLDNIFDDIGVALQGLGTQLLVPFTGLVAGVTEALTEAISGITRFIDPILDALTPLFDFLGSGLVTYATAWANTAEQAGNAIGAIITSVTRFSTIISTAITQAVGFVGNLVGKFLEFTGLAGTFGTVTTSIASAFGGLWDGIKSIVAGIGGFIDRVLKFAEDWLGIKTQVEQPVKAKVEVDTSQAEQASEAFSKTLEGIAANIEKAKNESAKFGQAGFDAAYTYEQAVKKLQEQLDAGILNETSFKMAVEDVTESYNAQIKTIEENAAAAERRAQAEKAAAQKILDDNRKIADTLLEQLRIENEFGGDSKRAKSAENVKAIEQEILRVEKELQAAREAGDTEAANKAASRIANLDQVLAKERDIASGAAAEREAEAKRAEEAMKELEKEAEKRRKAEEEHAKLVEKNREEIAKKQEELMNKVYDIEVARLKEINSLRLGGIKVNDIRTNEGADTFLNLLGGKQDEAIAEYRKSVKELQGLRKEIQKLAAQRVEILGGVG